MEIKCECPELDPLLLLISSLNSIATLISASLGAGRGLYCRQKADILSQRERESFRIKKGTKIWECLITSHPIPEPQGALKKEGQWKGWGDFRHDGTDETMYSQTHCAWDYWHKICIRLDSSVPSWGGGDKGARSLLGNLHKVVG